MAKLDKTPWAARQGTRELQRCGFFVKLKRYGYPIICHKASKPLPMIKEPFIQPRFVGPRFDEHTLPISVAKDLAAYEELVLELAKHLVRQKHGRVKKGFAQGFSLHIERIDDGSAKPALVAMMLGALLPGLPPEIVEAILDGCHTCQIGLPQLIQGWPIEWSAQVAALGLKQPL